MQNFVMDATEQTFDEDVIAASHRLPVVVDFWAPWCGPCRILGPLLDGLAEEGAGAWRLVKVNVDENPNLSTAWQVRGIPAVKAFRHGKVIDEFVGMQPEAHIRSWLDGFVPGPADEAVREAEAFVEEGKEAEARQAYERALSLRPRHGDALLGLARLEAAEGQSEQAKRHLDMILPDDADRLEQEIASLRLSLASGDLGEAERRAQAAPDDLPAQVEWGKALAASGKHEQALDVLFSVVQRSPRQGAGEDARQAMLEIFSVVGARSALSDRFRSRLATELYK